MSDIGIAKAALIKRILIGDGRLTLSTRKAAFEVAGLAGPLATLVDKVALAASQITDADFAAVKAAGVSEDQLFEAVVCAAVGQALRQYDAAYAALNAADGKD